MERTRAGYITAVTYTAVALVASGAFLIATLVRGDYTLVARLGGAGWVFLLSMIILMPTVTPWMKKRLELRDAEPAAAGALVAASTVSAAKVKDPVCGMDVDLAGARWLSEYQGTDYYFCSQACKEKFDENPSAHVS